jgi:hypothetical protein
MAIQDGGCPIHAFRHQIGAGQTQILDCDICGMKGAPDGLIGTVRHEPSQERAQYPTIETQDGSVGEMFKDGWPTLYLRLPNP